MAKSRTLLTAPTSSAARRLPSEREIFDTADMLSFVFDRPEAAALKQRFLEEVEFYRDWLQLQHDAEVRGIAYLFHLLLRCPQLLKRPPEWEWALRELEECLVQRRIDPSKDEAFWNAIDLVRKGMRTGRPRDRALDFFRYNLIHNLMHPPRELESSVKKFKKTKAVAQAAEAEQTLFRRSPDTRQIWRSYQRVDQFLRQIAATMQAESSRVSPPTKTPDCEPREGPRDTNKGITPSEIRKRVRRK